MNEVLTYLRENPTFHLATVDGDQARVRPFGAVAEFEGKLYICTGNGKAVYRQLVKTPKIELCGTKADGSYLRVTATAVRDDRVEARAAFLEQNEMLQGMYKPDDGVFEVFYLKDATAAFTSLTGVEKEVKF